MAARLKATLIAAVTLGVVETVRARPGGELSAWLLTGAALVATWICLGAVVVVLDSVVARAAFGVDSLSDLLQQRRQWFGQLWRQRHTELDAPVFGRLIGCLVGVVTWVMLGVWFVAQLVTHRHGATLIAVTAVAGLTGLGLVSLLVGRSVARAAAWFRRRTLQMPWSAPVAAIVLAVIALVCVVAAAIRFSEVIVATDTVSWLWPLCLVVGSVNLPLVLARTPSRWPWVVFLVAPFVLWGALRNPLARVEALRDSDTSKYVLRHFVSREQGPTSSIDPQSIKQPLHPTFEVPAGPRPNLVLITIDSVRVDHLGFMGYQRPTSPALDKIANDSVVFSRAYSQDSGTGPSLWSLFVGKTPFQVALRDAGKFPPLIAPEETTLTEALAKSGYDTHAVVCGYAFDSPRFGVRRGFASYGNVCGNRRMGIAKTVTDKGLARLESLREPYFLWLHYYEPHAPYERQPDYDFGSSPIDRYDSEIRYADAHIERFISALDRRQHRVPVVLAVTADHGENFGEHGKAQHARNLYTNVTHVPLLFRGPQFVRRTIDTPVAMSDIFPTFLALAKTPDPGSTMTSQAPVLYGLTPGAGRLVYQENSYSRPRRHTKGIIDGDYHMIMDLTTGVDELYNLRVDPSEKRNLVGTGLSEESKLRQRLERFIATTKLPPQLSR